MKNPYPITAEDITDEDRTAAKGYGDASECLLALTLTRKYKTLFAVGHTHYWRSGHYETGAIYPIPAPVLTAIDEFYKR